MNLKLGPYVLWAAVASAVGFIVLLGYFFEFELLIVLRLLLIQWAVLLAAAALLLGLFNLLAVHWNKVSLQDDGWPYSALLILMFLVTLVLGLLFGPDFPAVLLLFEYVQVPVEASLLALLAISLTVAGFRLLSRRKDLISLAFMGTAIVVLLGTAPWVIGGDSIAFEAVSIGRAWLTQVWATAGARGVLLGVALGAVTTGLRVLLASDRPYGE